jgi:uncharacterized protein
MSMQLDVAKIREGHQRVERTDEPSAFTAEDSYTIVSPVHLGGDLQRSGGKVRLTGRLQTVIELACSRCLEALPVPVDTKYELLYLPASEEAAAVGEERELEDEDLGTSYYRDGVIDLADLVREQIYLALPMKPLCQDACRGLCPQCGTNLNTGSCTCAPGWEDPRLAPLKALARNNDDA